MTTGRVVIAWAISIVIVLVIAAILVLIVGVALFALFGIASSSGAFPVVDGATVPSYPFFSAIGRSERRRSTEHPPRPKAPRTGSSVGAGPGRNRETRLHGRMPARDGPGAVE